MVRLYKIVQEEVNKLFAQCHALSHNLVFAIVLFSLKVKGTNFS